MADICRHTVPMNRQRGYTLIETLVALALLIILGVAGVSGWQLWQQQQRLWQTAWQVRNFLFYLRNDANGYNRNHLLLLQREATGWCLYSTGSSSRCLPGDPLVMRPLWPEVAVEELTPGLGFYGLRNTAWSGHIRLRSPAGQWRIVVSDWGRIRMCYSQEGGGC